MKINARIQNLFTFLAVFALTLELICRLLPSENREKKGWFDVTVTQATKRAPWYQGYQADHGQLRRNFRAYEIYGLDPYLGTQIRIDDDGYRRTLQSNWSDPNLRIGVFGGSTVWGGHVPDEQTIPSWLSQSLSEKFNRFEVLNYAEVGFVFSQELHRAIRILYSDRVSESPVPKVMVFVNGINDALAALNNLSHGIEKPSGLPWEYEKYQHLFKLGNTGEVGWSDFFKKSKAVRLFLKATHRWDKKEKARKGYWAEPSPEELLILADQVAKKYVDLIRISHSLLSAEHVQTLFVLQPIMAHKNLLSKEESALYERNLKWQPYLVYVYERISERAMALPSSIAFVNMSHLFKANQTTLYADAIHYSSEGNRLIAQTLASHVAALLDRDVPALRSISGK